MSKSGTTDLGVALGVLCILLFVFWVAPRVGAYWNQRHFMVGRTKPVRSRLDGRLYRVHLAHDDPEAAADHLAYLHQQTVKLMAALRRKYDLSASSDHREIAAPARQEIVRRLLDRYDRDLIAESSPNNPEGDTSFTIGKGMVLALCLREKDPARLGSPAVHDFHDNATTWFVTVHELAHLGVQASGHPPEFWSAFKFLLQECEAADLAPAGGWPNYNQHPVQYCGLSVDYNPIFDHSMIVPN